jgi:predicted HicB family RNase H-like nuclease
MTNIYTYKGYQAKFEVEPEDAAIFVSVANAPKIHNMTEGKTVAEAKAAFDAMIDEYLAACAAEGWEVSQPLSIIVPA